MRLVTQLVHHLLVTISQLWHHQSRVNELSPLLVLLLASVAIALRGMDIVEALQCLKCMYHNDLIFREVVVATEEEEELEEMDLDLVVNDVNDGDKDFTWDQLLFDDGEDMIYYSDN